MRTTNNRRNVYSDYSGVFAYAHNGVWPFRSVL